MVNDVVIVIILYFAGVRNDFVDEFFFLLFMHSTLSRILHIISNNDIPSEYIHCLNVADKIPGTESMVVVSQQVDLYDTVSIE
jgi:hypothetical protein